MYHPELYPEKAIFNVKELNFPKRSVKQAVEQKVKQTYGKELLVPKYDMSIKDQIEALRSKKGLYNSFLENNEVRKRINIVAKFKGTRTESPHMPITH